MQDLDDWELEIRNLRFEIGNLFCWSSQLVRSKNRFATELENNRSLSVAVREIEEGLKSIACFDPVFPQYELVFLETKVRLKCLCVIQLFKRFYLRYMTLEYVAMKYRGITPIVLADAEFEKLKITRDSFLENEQ
ncbi:MAG TPA: hypothetical protein DET40_09865 [Lentisphaeria bacterium]|nr:MAG: hypothetical protein A2X45_08650 [Lentisphaerae bacterium GWF2_50_93]HCE43841.1 hypothetical protein [Lentisphaeria bacterium]